MMKLNMCIQSPPYLPQAWGRNHASTLTVLILAFFLILPLLVDAQIPPVSSTPQVASATPQSVTRKPDILNTADAVTQRVINSVSGTIDGAKHLLVNVVGGEASTSGAFMDGVLSLITGDLLGRPIWLYLFSLCIVLGALFLRHMIARRFGQVLARLAARTQTTLDDKIIEACLPCLRFSIALFGIYVAFQVFFSDQPLPVPDGTALDRFRLFFRAAIYLLVLGTLAWAFIRFADVMIEWMASRAKNHGYTIDETFIPIGRRTVKVFVVVVAALQALSYLQFDAVVNSLLAAAGVGGLAIGLAAQDTLKNLFGSIVLLLDRPFSVGDLIVAGGIEGYVDTVGLRSTRIRTYERTLVTVPNSSIVDRDIDNLDRRPVRRINAIIGVTYSTKPDEMEDLLRRIRTLLQNDPGVWQEYMVVRFQEFGASSLDIRLTYFSKSIVWDEHLEVRERINLGIMRILEEMGLEIAFPTQTVHFHNEDERTRPAV
ncbi:MAG: mechanosensitive ion channel family protein [bacterium]